MLTVGLGGGVGVPLRENVCGRRDRRTARLTSG